MLRRYFTHMPASSKLVFLFSVFLISEEPSMSLSTPAGSPNIYSVSALNQAVRRLLESNFGEVWLIGEVSNFSAPSSGHWYFTLKDERSQVRCAMFKGANQRVNIQVGHGKQVLVRCKPGVYEARGDYQLIVEHLEDAGVGLLQQQFEQLKARLQAEGLFDPAFKRPLPEQIKRIGVVTSPTGAALHDVLSVLKRRDPSVEVMIYPTQVQGAQAPGHIIQALNTANQRNEVDVILLTRGGGSLEDLWCFNDETLARVVRTSQLPVVSAVGHEVDFSICDFVADSRAATPSAAAELLSQDSSHLLQRHQQIHARLNRAWSQLNQQRQHNIALLAHRLAPLHPQQQLNQHAQRLDDQQRRLNAALSRATEQRNWTLQTLQKRLLQLKPEHQIAQANQRYHLVSRQLEQTVQRKMDTHKQRLATQAHALQLVSPLQTLTRGYSITQTADGRIIKHADDVKTGETITTRLASGELHSQVIKNR